MSFSTYRILPINHGNIEDLIGWPQPEAAWSGVSFPARDWGQSRLWEHLVLATRPGVSKDKALAPWLCRNEFPWRRTVVKTSKMFIRRKRVQVSVDRQWADSRGSLSAAWGSFSHHFMGPFSWLLLVNQNDFQLDSESIFGVSEESSHVRAHLSQ